MTDTPLTLDDLGWSDSYLPEEDAQADTSLPPARISGIHRDRASVLAASGAELLTLPPDLSAGDIAVGDWVLYDPGAMRIARLLPRRTRLFRRAAGDASREQLIVANVDFVFITTSCTDEFNEARLERYLSLAHSGGVPPVLLLTKADKTDDPGAYLARLHAIAPDVAAVPLNAKDRPAVTAALARWSGPGRTVAFLGMSGVGKSTLAAALSGRDLATAEVREDDMKGRHTTTAREMHPLPGGGWLIDTPGMRELRLTDMAEGIDAAFGEITDLAADCRFRDCTHGPEPGCAVRAAIAAGRIDASRLDRWKKLKAEDAAHSASAAEKRRQGRSFARMVKQAKRQKRRD
ncbi:MAG: ribosome small subunit-dependent GTPase A [Rhodobacteraceae bacterium]|nr:ribosome small subunit-dependent GTPase A [Paracoccaceae bacterium]